MAEISSLMRDLRPLWEIDREEVLILYDEKTVPFHLPLYHPLPNPLLPINRDKLSKGEGTRKGKSFLQERTTRSRNYNIQKDSFILPT